MYTQGFNVSASFWLLAFRKKLPRSGVILQLPATDSRTPLQNGNAGHCWEQNTGGWAFRVPLLVAHCHFIYKHLLLGYFSPSPTHLSINKIQKKLKDTHEEPTKKELTEFHTVTSTNVTDAYC